MHIVCKQVSELLGGIRLLKLFAWEQPAMKKVMQVGVGDQEMCSLGIECVLITFIHMLCKQVMQVRDQEMAALRRFGILSALQVPLSLSLLLSLSLSLRVCSILFLRVPVRSDRAGEGQGETRVTSLEA